MKYLQYLFAFMISFIVAFLITYSLRAEPKCKPITEDTYHLYTDMCMFTYKQRGYDEKQTSCMCNLQDQNLRRMVIRRKLTCESEIRYSWFALTTSQKEMCVR